MLPDYITEILRWGRLALAASFCAANLGAGASARAQSEPRADDEAAAQHDDILESPDWQETMKAWEEWSTVQKLYDQQQINNMEQELIAKVRQMSPEEQAAFHDDLRAKLHILMGAEARDARRWLSDTLAVASKKYASKIRAGLPDVANLSAEELQTELDQFEQRRSQKQHNAAEFEQARLDRVRALQADLRQQHEDREKALDRASRSASTGGGNFAPPVRQKRQSYPNVYPAYPVRFGWGFW